MAMILLPETDEQCEEWLASKDKDEIVGHTCDADDCLVYHFLRSLGASASTCVFGSQYRSDGDWQEYPTPLWARELIFAFDVRPGVQIGVTAGDALATLRSLRWQREADADAAAAAAYLAPADGR